LPPLKATDYSQQPPKLPEGLEADTTVQELVGDEYAVAPLVGPSYDNLQPSPIRGGHLRITRLWLVDTFGRVRRIVETIDDENRHENTQECNGYSQHPIAKQARIPIEVNIHRWPHIEFVP